MRPGVSTTNPGASEQQRSADRKSYAPAQRVLAIKLPTVRTILLIMTIVGGLIAAVWVAELSRRTDG